MTRKKMAHKTFKVVAEANRHGEPINLTSKDGKHMLTATAFENGVGIWLGQKGTDNCVHLVSIQGQGCYLGFHPAKAEGGCPLAFYLDDNGKPHMQLAHGDHVHQVALHDLFDLIARVEKLESA